METGLDDCVTETLASPEQVLRFLKEHPTFLRDYPEVLAAVLPERKLGDNVEDLQAFSLRALRSELNALRTGAEELIANARDNMSVQSRTHTAALALLSAETPEALGRTVAEDLPLLLQVDAAAVCAEPGFPPALGRIVHPLKLGDVAALLGERDIALRALVAPDSVLHGDAAGLVASDALVRLPVGIAAPPTLLMLGARHAETFRDGQGTELLSFLAGVLGACVRRWANDEPHRL